MSTFMPDSKFASLAHDIITAQTLCLVIHSDELEIKSKLL